MQAGTMTGPIEGCSALPVASAAARATVPANRGARPIALWSVFNTRRGSPMNKRPGAGAELTVHWI